MFTCTLHVSVHIFFKGTEVRVAFTRFLRTSTIATQNAVYEMFVCVELKMKIKRTLSTTETKANCYPDEWQM